MESTLKFQRGDIYFVRLDSSTGSEQNGTRPAVILQNDVGNSCSPTLIVATLTSKTEKKAMQPTHCLVVPEGLEPSIVQAEQIFTIDKSRVQNFAGHLTPEEMSRVDDAVKISLALNPMGSIPKKLKPIVRSMAAYAPPEVVDGKPPVYPYTPIKSDFEDAGTVEEMMLYTELQSAVHAMIQRLEYSFTFNPSLLTSPKRKKQVAEILTEAEKYIWRILKIIIYRSDDTMVDKFSQVAGNIPVTNDDLNRRYTVINGYPVVLSFAKEPNPGVFDRIRDILLATSYTKTTS